MNIYVGNLSSEVTEDDLRREFVAFGEVISVTIVNATCISHGQSRGHGFVEMPSLSEGEAAISALHGRTLGPAAMNVIQALPLSKPSGRSCRGERAGRPPAGRASLV